MQWLAVAGRWYLGSRFVFMGMDKTIHPVEFLKLLRQYNLTQAPWLLDTIAALLPWFEVFCGLLLVAGIGVRGTAVILVGLLVPFTGVVLHRALAIHAARAIAFCAIKFDCGCGAGEEFICRKLAENSAYILLAAWLVWNRSDKLCLRFSLASLGREGTQDAT
jgi:uncharacterized membrane protein YphA (DoxX/SURF4 family)